MTASPATAKSRLLRGRQWPGRARRGERLTFNYAKAFVDKVTSYLLNGSSIQVEGGETPEAAPPPPVPNALSAKPPHSMASPSSTTKPSSIAPFSATPATRSRGTPKPAASASPLPTSRASSPGANPMTPRA
ncbi:MAG: hypothetical protein IPF51_16325 [Dehalococcoidia bacterium]|uniref:hypothetical protein n=1 Tax=Candidatus Amarobacter glycogenicus TaxID=3140699 RepID=UPI0031346DD8|nr:hypothetical protein [Dehalococcoidia bacterium]